MNFEIQYIIFQPVQVEVAVNQFKIVLLKVSSPFSHDWPHNFQHPFSCHIIFRLEIQEETSEYIY